MAENNQPQTSTPTGNKPATEVSPAAPAPTPTAGAPTTHPQRIAALYVGDLHPDVTESDLLEFFKSIGSIQSIKVCRDSTTRRSLGYAYVNFTRVDDADRGISLLNYSLLKGKPVRICWSQRDPSRRRSNVGNLYIKNFPKDLDALALEEIFGKFGPIISCKLQTDDDGNSLGYGFVHFEKEEDAQKAIEKMHGYIFSGKTLYVQKFLPKGQRQKSNSASVFTNVYVKELPADVTNEELVKIFEDCGKITSPFVRTPPPQNRPTTFGFINFETHEMALKAVETMNGKEYKGKKLFVTRAQSKSERMAELKRNREELYAKTKHCNLYVCPIPLNWTEQQFRDEFAKFGTITSAVIMRQADGVSKGFGFVCFSTPEEATAARETVIKVEGKQLTVNLAQKKEERRRFLEEQHARTMRVQMGYPRGFTPWAGGMPPAQFGPYPARHANFMPGMAPSQNFVMGGGMRNIVAELAGAIAVTHPENAGKLAKIIYDADKDPNETAALLKDPHRLQQRINESLAIFERSGGN